MNIETITMDRHVAAGKLSAASRMLKRQKKNAEWEALRDGYAALARGTPLVNPFQAIREAGLDSQGRPLLALARADQTRVRCQVTDGVWWHQGQGAYFQRSVVSVNLTPPQFRHWRADTCFKVERARPLPMPVGGWKHQPYTGGEAIVPMIPPDVYPKRGHGSPKDWHILWEADWTDAPVDPILLKHIGGDLFAVLAAWELTSLERAVISGTRAE